MTEEQAALARRAVACKGWRWMPGMLTSDDFRVCRVDSDGYKFGYRTEYNYAYAVIGDVVPDLEDPATLGCLLALVREAWGDHEAYTMRWHDEDGGWTVCSSDEHGCHSVAEGQTEAEALVAALEGAP